MDMNHLSVSIILFMFFCSHTILPGQTNTSSPYGALSNTQSVRDELGIAVKNGMQNAYTFGSRYEGIKGLPFYKNSWSEGVVCLKKDSVVVNKPELKLRFDAYANELWIKQGKDSMIAYSKDINWFVLIDGDLQETFIKAPLINKDFPNYFYKLMFKGDNYILYKELRKELIRADLVDKGMVSTGLPYDRFEEKIKYYLKTGENTIKKIKPSRKSFIKELPKRYEKKLISFCNNSDISGKLSEQEMIDILTFLQNQK